MIGGIVLAQDAPAPVPGGGAGNDQPPAVEQPLSKQANVSADDMTKQTPKLLHEMEDVLRRVVQIQKIAQKQNDVMKLNCVNDKLLRIKGYLNVADARKTEMAVHLDSNELDMARDAYGQIVVSADEVRALGAEAEQCIGQELVWVGPQQNSVEGGNEPDDPTKGDEPGFPEVDPLPCASCAD
jgi:hypothetical protein